MSRSVRFHEFGDASVLRIEDVAVGEPASGEVRLRIHAIGLNRTEITLRSGRAARRDRLDYRQRFRSEGSDYPSLQRSSNAKRNLENQETRHV